MPPSFPLNEVKDEFGDLRPPDEDKAARVFDSFFSHGESDLDDETSDPFKEDRDEGELAENGGSLQSSDFGFMEDLQILFGSAIQPFRSRSKGSEGLESWGAPDDFSNESGILFDRHMFDEAVVIDKEGTKIGELF